jgi:Protein of unknown function (DUF4031)
VAVYVYQFAGQRKKPFTVAYPNPWFGLTGDTAEELHSFAGGLGLSRQLYRPLLMGGVEVPLVGHYELSLAERNRAVASGAESVTAREHDKRLGQQAAALGIKLD